MTSTTWQGLNSAPMTEAERMIFAARPDPLAIPSVLAGTWSAPDGPDRTTTLQHVHALDAVKTFLTSVGHHAWWSMRSWESVLVPLSGGRADSQGRMDLITRVSGKLKDFVNAPAMGRPG